MQAFNPSTKAFVAEELPDHIADDVFDNSNRNMWLRPLLVGAPTSIKLFDAQQFRAEVDQHIRSGLDARAELFHKCQWTVSFVAPGERPNHRGNVVSAAKYYPKSWTLKSFVNSVA